MIYDKSSHKEAEYHHNMMMNHTLKEALAKDRVVPFFQPILNVRTYEIEKYETLMRIQKANEGYYVPSEFLDVAKHFENLLRTLHVIDPKGIYGPSKSHRATFRSTSRTWI